MFAPLAISSDSRSGGTGAKSARMKDRLRAEIFWVRLPGADVGAGLWQERVHQAGAEAPEAETGEDASWFSRGDLGHGGPQKGAKVKFAISVLSFSTSFC